MIGVLNFNLIFKTYLNRFSLPRPTTGRWPNG